MNLNKHTEIIVFQIQNLKTHLKTAILDLPDDLKPLGSKSFTVKFSDLAEADVWTAFYYDFEHQAQSIVELIDELPVDKIPKFFKTLTTEKNYGGYSYNSIRYNPKFIDHIKKIILKD